MKNFFSPINNAQFCGDLPRPFKIPSQLPCAPIEAIFGKSTNDLGNNLCHPFTQKISTSLSESSVKSDTTDTTDTPTTLDDNQEDTMKQDLQRMEFKLNQQPLSFQ